MNLLCLFLFLGFASSAFSLTVISDLDDTIKITEVRNKAAAAVNGMVGTVAFTGMPQLLRSFKLADPSSKLIVVSGSPSIVAGNVRRLLFENQIQADEVHLLGKSERKLEFLLNLIQDIDDEVILFGDDQEFDPAFYEQVRALAPQKVRAIYIHQANNKKIPQGQIGYYTAYEIALNEVGAGRLQSGSLVKQSILKDVNSGDPFIDKRATKRLIPSWHKCGPANFLNAAKIISAELGFEDQDYFSVLERIVRKNCEH